VTKPGFSYCVCVVCVIVYFVMDALHVSFCAVRFSLSVVSQEIGWEERLRNDLFCVGLDVKLTQSIP